MEQDINNLILQNFINKIDKQNKEITKVLNLANEMLKEMGG